MQRTVSAGRPGPGSPRPASQVAILAVGAVWRADYELYAHSAAARAAGISEHAVKALANGEIADDLSDEEKIAGRVARQLCLDHRRVERGSLIKIE